MIKEFSQIKPSQQLQQAIEEQAEKQKQYQRQHKIIDLQQFGISQAQIARDFDFVFAEYDLERDSANATV